MKKAVVLVFIILFATACYVSESYASESDASESYASEISDTFLEKYNALKPTENTSVRSDYLFEQIALGSEFTIKILDQMNDQNDDLNEKVDVLIKKFDTLIEQNNKIIKLLEKRE